VVLRSLLGVLTLPVWAPYKGVKQVIEEIQSEVQREQLDEQRIISKLTELQLQLELQEIDQEEYERHEGALMEHLAAAREYKRRLEEAGHRADF